MLASLTLKSQFRMYLADWLERQRSAGNNIRPLGPQG
jgi:hypothetical protein